MDIPAGKSPATPGNESDKLAATLPEAASASDASGASAKPQDVTQVFRETVPTAQSKAKTAPPVPRPAAATTQPAGLGATDLFSEKRAAPTRPATTPPAPPGQSAKTTPPSMNATKASAEAQPRATSPSKPTAPQQQPTQPLGATGDFVDSAVEPNARTRQLHASAEPAKPASAPPAAPAKPETPDAGTTFGDFRLDKKLGEGGMGAVYKAQQISMDRTVALKLLAKNLSGNQGFVERFKREARTMAKLDHPNIVRGLAVGEVDGQHYVAMEFIDGLSMQKWMDKLGRLSVGDAVHVVLCSAHALKHAHDQSLIHRDIKPDNILMTSKGVVKIADLGLAKKTDDDMSLTQSGTGFGTPYYMPLEQYRDAKHVDGRADIYALGVTLYYFLTGRLPFYAETHFDVIKLKEAAKFTPARKHNPEIPERLDLMIDKMIQKDKKHRYQTCDEVLESLESLGLASEFPSFIAAPHASGAATGKAGPAAPTRMSTLPPKSKSAAPAPTDDEPAREMWVLRYKDESGKVAKRQVSTGRLRQLIERGEVDPSKATVQRATEQNQRPISGVAEFASLAQSKSVESRADRRSQKLENAYERLEADARRQALMRRITNFLRSVGGLIMLLAVIAGLALGGWWLFKNKDTVVQKVQDATKAMQEPAGTEGKAEPPKQ